MTPHNYTQMPGFLPGAGYQPPRSGPTTTTEQAKPRLAYFITRTNGLAVPLIPADELPFTVKLQNVPRVLNPQDTYGLQYIGTSPYTGSTFKLDSGIPSAAMQRSNSQPPNDPSHVHSQSGNGTRQFLAPDAIARQAFANSTATSPSTGNFAMSAMRPVSASENAKSWRRSDPIDSSDATQSVIDAILRSEAGAQTAERIGYRSRDTTPPPSGIMPDQNKKIFCTHWIMTGDCKYVQQGCRYKHEMPTEAKLKELGIRHTPRWWQEQNAAIKLGGARHVLAPTMRPMEMLSMSKDEEADDESSSDEGGDDESEVELLKVVKKQGSPVKEAIVGSKQILKPEMKQVLKPEIKSPVMAPQPSSPAAQIEETRKSSHPPGDLIDFEPLQPTSRTPTTPLGCSAASPSNSPRNDFATMPASTPISKTSKVFVPAGESPEAHIAEMKKRERSTRQKRTPSPVRANGSPDTSSSVKSTGLLASKHAPSSSDNSPKRNRVGCRIRRPATSSPGGGADKKEKV